MFNSMNSHKNIFISRFAKFDVFTVIYKFIHSNNWSYIKERKENDVREN